MNDNVLYVGLGAEHIYALNAADGALFWLYQTKGVVRAQPVEADGTVYAASEDGAVYALDATTKELRWRYQTDGSIFSSPAVADGLVYHWLQAMATSTRSMPPAAHCSGASRPAAKCGRLRRRQTASFR